jgi:peptide/nickel transport system substrate-binding protein
MWLAGLIAFALVAAACGDSGDAADDPTTTTAAPATTAAPDTTVAPTTTEAPVTTTTEAPGKPYGGQVITSQAQEPPTLNGFVPGGNNLVVGLIGNGYARGVQRVNGFTLQFEPDLVTELPTVGNGAVVVNADGTMTVSYSIKDEAEWSDGTPITGADFQFTLDTILDPESQADKATYEDIVSSDFTDKSFTFTLSAPTVQFELIFDEIIPKHAVEGTNFLLDWNETRWPSNGPFIFDEWSKGEFVRIVRNDNYFGTDPETGQTLPYLDEIVFRFIGETEGELNAFAARETDVVQPDPNTDVIERLQGLSPDGAVVEVLSGPIWEHLSFQFAPTNRNPETLNANLNFRKAVAHAVNKQLLVDEILAGQVEPLTSWVEAYNPAISNSNWAQYDYNPETAADYLAQACADEGRDCDTNPVKVIFSTTSNNDARAKIAQILGENLTAIGVDYEQQLEDSSLFFGETKPNGTADLQEWAWLGTPGLAGVIGILDIWDAEQPGPAGANQYYWGTEGSTLVNDASDRFAELRDMANSTVDEAELVVLLQEMEQIQADEVVLIPLYARLTVMAFWADEVAGVKHNAASVGYTWNLGEWHRVDG